LDKASPVWFLVEIFSQFLVHYNILIIENMSRRFDILFLFVVHACLPCYCVTDGASNCTQSLHLKFHKVGGGSVNVALRKIYANTSWYTCHGDPYSHDMLNKFEDLGLEGIKKKCTTEKCDTQIISVFREPVEKTISQLYFFNQELSTWANKYGHHDVVEKLWHSPLSISKVEMANLIEAMQQGYASLSLNLRLFEYETILSRSKVYPFKSSPETISRALSEVDQLSIVGTTEEINSFFVLMSIVRNIPLHAFCNLHKDHGAGNTNKIMFNSTDRPPADKLFQPEVLAYLSAVGEGETQIWNRANEVHIEQLKKHNLSLNESIVIWNKACGKNSNHHQPKQHKEQEKGVKGGKKKNNDDYAQNITNINTEYNKQ
jgi:hypothetical protein